MSATINATTRRFRPVDIIRRRDFRKRVTEEILDWVNDRTGQDQIIVRCEDGSIEDEGNTFGCEHCDERHHSDNSCSVYIRINNRNREVEWCEGCRGSSAFYCEGTGDYHSCDDFTEVEADGNAYCYERYGDELHHWERDDEYHTEPEPEHSNDEDSDGVAGYHSLNRPWENRTPPPLTIGVELETWANNACDHAHLAMRLGLLAERDGSLCSQHGVEIIGKPMLMAEYSSPSSPWRKLFEQSSKAFKAWDAGSGYGMHVNLNRTGLNSLHQAKIICFIHGHRAFCEQVAGRTEAQATSASGCKWTEYTQKRIGRCKENGKYEAASMREGRIEVRIFRATRKWESFMKNVEFCDSVRSYCGERALVDINLPNYLSYVTSQSGRWPNFCAWLSARMGKERVAQRLLIPATFALKGVA